MSMPDGLAHERWGRVESTHGAARLQAAGEGKVAEKLYFELASEAAGRLGAGHKTTLVARYNLAGLDEGLL